MTEEEIRRKGMRRLPGARSGAYGVSYLYGGYYLSPDQFGYTTSQTWGSSGGGEMTTTGSGGESGGDAGGGSA